MKTFELILTSTLGDVHKQNDVRIMTLTLISGEIGVMADMIPIASSTKVGIAKITDENNVEQFVVLDSGIFLFNHNKLEIIADNFYFKNDDSISIDKKLSDLTNDIETEESERVKTSLEEKMKFWNLAKKLNSNV